MLNKYDLECLQKAKAYIDKNSREHHSIDDIARTVGMGATRLKEAFKQYYGSGLYTYLREQRMKRAAELLEDNDKTIKEIAKGLGFKHTSNFTTAFKKKFAVTPAKFRRIVRRGVN
jgi:AraC-like DNA-binding protein